MNQLFPTIQDEDFGSTLENEDLLSHSAASHSTTTPTKFQALTAINLNLLKHSQILYSPHSGSRRPSLQLAHSLYSQGTDGEEERHSPTQPILIGQFHVMDEKTTELMNALEFKNVEMLTLIKNSTTPRSSIVAVSAKNGSDAPVYPERRGSTRSDQLTHTDTTEDIDYDDDDYLVGDGFLEDVRELEVDTIPPAGQDKPRSPRKVLYPADEDDLDEDIFGMEL